MKENAKNEDLNLVSLLCFFVLPPITFTFLFSFLGMVPLPSWAVMLLAVATVLGWGAFLIFAPESEANGKNQLGESQATEK